MPANITETTTASAVKAPAAQAESSPGVPKKITNAQTVCNEKNEKGKLCNGHLKQVHTGGEEAAEHLRGDDVLFKCQFCGTLYMGPPLGHVRDPDKQQRFVERELTAILQAAGGTLPAIVRNEKGAYVLAETSAPPAHAPAKPAVAAKPAPTTAAAQAPAAVASAQQPAASSAVAKPTDQAANASTSAAKPATEAKTPTGYVPPPAPGPVPGETQEQKLARLRAIVAEAKRRKAAAEAAAAGGQPETVQPTAQPAPRTQPSAASTSGTDSSAQADAHRPAAEAQAATGQASAVPLSPMATASPAAGAEQVSDLAPDASTERASAATGTPGRAAFDTGPVPGETHEQKIARLKKVVNAARELAGKPPKY